LGWDTPSAPSQSGKYFSRRSFGHLGYTGTSLWIDPERQLSIALLTNRTWPDCSNKAIKDVRPAFQDAVVEALERAL
jgi:CubicO group peptidase (beta-lactamase class C family)